MMIGTLFDEHRDSGIAVYVSTDGVIIVDPQLGDDMALLWNEVVFLRDALNNLCEMEGLR